MVNDEENKFNLTLKNGEKEFFRIVGTLSTLSPNLSPVKGERNYSLPSPLDEEGSGVR